MTLATRLYTIYVLKVLLNQPIRANRDIVWPYQTFNADLSLWNVYTVRNMASTSTPATVFTVKRDLSQWDVFFATTMSTSMFAMAANFNSELSQWNTSSCQAHAWHVLECNVGLTNPSPRKEWSPKRNENEQQRTTRLNQGHKRKASLKQFWREGRERSW